MRNSSCSSSRACRGDTLDEKIHQSRQCDVLRIIALGALELERMLQLGHRIKEHSELVCLSDGKRLNECPHLFGGAVF